MTMEGGRVVEKILLEDKNQIWIGVVNPDTGGPKSGTHLEMNEDSLNIQVDDIIWWDEQWAFWSVGKRGAKAVSDKEIRRIN